MKTVIRSIILAIILAGIMGGVIPAQQRPFWTDDLQFMKMGQIRFELGVTHLQNVKIVHSGLEGNLSRIGVGSMKISAGDWAEFQLAWTAANVLTVDRYYKPSEVGPLKIKGGRTIDVGDVVIGTKFRLYRETFHYPGIGFKFQVKLPNARNEKGIGTDGTNFFALFIFQKSFGRARVFSNFGMAILEDPRIGSAQTDQLVYGLATVIPVSHAWEFVADFRGMAMNPSVVFPDRNDIRAGLRWGRGAWRWDLGTEIHLREDSPGSGMFFGMSCVIR